MEDLNLPSQVQYSFVAPPQQGEASVEGFELKYQLVQNLLKLQVNPAIPAALQEEAKGAQESLDHILKQVWIKSFEDEEETKPKEIAFEMNSIWDLDLKDKIRYRFYEILSELRDLIERDEAVEQDIANYDEALYYANSQHAPASHDPKEGSFIDTDQIIQFAAQLVYEAFGKESVWMAIQMTIMDRKGPNDPPSRRLYPNSRTINLNEFGISKAFSDNLSKIIQEANKQTAIDQFQNSGKYDQTRKTGFKTSGKANDAEFVIDKEKLAIKTAEQFADQLMKVRDAKVLQTFFALVKWGNLNDTFTYREVPISEIMALILKSNSDNKFNTPQRREFSEVLEYLASISLTINFIGDQVNTKTGKTKAVLREEKGVKLFRLVATYSVKKEFQNLPKESLIADMHFDKSVITRFSGELFPGNTQLFKQRANVYFDSLLHLNANTDAKAILLGFQIQTRFNQIPDKEKCIEYDRAFLIDLCDYGKTDNTKPSKATKQIANNLNKLKESGIILKYTGLTSNNTDKIKIYPPKISKLEASS